MNRLIEHTTLNKQCHSQRIGGIMLLIACWAVSSCASPGRIPEPARVAEVGSPLIFDGNRLLQEYSERRIEIDKAISQASIEDIETTARIATSTRFELGLSAGRLTEPTALAAYRESQLADAQTSRNQVALQNILVERAENQAALSNQQASQIVENGQVQSELNELRLDNYKSLIAHYTELLRTTPNTEGNKNLREDAINNLTAIRTEMATLSSETTSIAAPAQPSIAGDDKTIALSDLLPGTGAAQATTKAEGQEDNKTVENSALEALTKALGEVGSLSTTRQERFQQYQAYIDELYGTRNQFLLDDSHRRPGRRLIRLVMPIYVPPSKSNKPRTVRFVVSNSKLIDTAEKTLTNELYRSATSQALTLMSNRIDDNTHASYGDERRVQIETLYELLNPGVSASSCTSTSRTCACGNLAFFERKTQNWSNTAGSGASIENTRRFSKDDTSKYTEEQIKKKYSVLEKNCWGGLNAAKIIGVKNLNHCYVYNPDNATWRYLDSKDGKCDLISQDGNKNAEIYSLRPRIEREKIERADTRLLGIAVALGQTFGSSSGVGSASASANYTKERFIQAASRVPVISAYTGPTKTIGKTEFGWHVYPRIALSDKNKPVREHTGTQFNGTVDLSVPVSWGTANIKVYLDESAQPVADYPISIPELKYSEIMSNTFTQPVVTENRDYGLLNEGKQVSFAISGMNLWKSPEVNLGGRNADNLQYISGNPNHLLATFNNLKGISCNYNKLNYNQTKAQYRKGLTIDSNKLCAAEIMVHTTEGRDFAGSVLVAKSSTPAKPVKSPDASAPTAAMHRATITGDILTLIIQEPVDAAYTPGSQAAIDHVLVGSKGASGFLKLETSEVLPANPKLKLVKFEGKVSDKFCRGSDGRLLLNCFVTLKISKSTKYSGNITIQSLK